MIIVDDFAELRIKDFADCADWVIWISDRWMRTEDDSRWIIGEIRSEVRGVVC